MKNTSFTMNRQQRANAAPHQISTSRSAFQLLFFVFALLGSVGAWGQTVNDYRSAATGIWNVPGTWERWDGMNWVMATVSPTGGNAEAITIRSPHVVTVTANVNVDQVTVDAGGQVTIDSGVNWRIIDGAGTDLTVNGIVDNMGTIGNDNSVSLEEIINGTVINRSAYSFVMGTLTFNDGSTYEHARNGGTIPTAAWNINSTCEITGVQGNVPNGTLNQTFGNIKWNCPGMTRNRNFGNALLVIAGNFEIISTAAVQLNLNQTLLTIGGNFTQSGGTFRIAAGANAQTLTVGGSFSLSGGTLTMGNGTGAGVINVGGGFSLGALGNLTETGAGTRTINFTGSGNCTSSGTLSNTINFDINTGATVSFGAADLSGSNGTFTNNGTLKGTGPLTIPTGGALQNDGTVAPGNSIGLLEIIGDFTNNGILEIEVEGTPLANDLLTVSGNVNLGGTLNVIKTGGTISMGDMFTVVTSTLPMGISGTFASLSFPGGTASWGGGPTYGPSDLILGYTAATPLAIELISFTGKRIDKTIELNWQTANEQNNDFMAVERSADGVRFTEIGRVNGAGTTQEMQHYAFIDTAPLAGTNYYRLRQVDLDGQMEYHKVISVDFVDNKPTGNTIRLFPNPASDQLQVTWEGGYTGTSLFQIFNATGQLVATYQVSADQTSYEMPLQELAAGTYFLKFTQGSQVETLRFVKQ